MATFLRMLGSLLLDRLREMGNMFIFLLSAAAVMVKPPFKVRLILQQIRFFGNESLLVILLIRVFTGMVLALQIYYILQKFGSEALLGPAVALTIIIPAGTDIPVEYRILRGATKWEVYDIVIEGISLVNNYRTQFTEIIQSSPYDNLVQRLRSKVVKQTNLLTL
jgi:hypothetical protein